jgi:hypothetical protein
MKVGAVTETVSVDASGLALNRTNASVSTVIDRQLISTIPLNGRSLQDLILATPGIVTQSPQVATRNGTQTQGDFSVNGERTDANSYFVDGVAAIAHSGPAPGNSRIGMDSPFASLTALGTTQSLVPADALQEFRVLSSTYSAEFGRTPGGQFTFLTRSGTNQAHGSFYDYYRSNLLDAQDWFSTEGPRYSYTPAYYVQNNFGATLGAPIIFPKVYNGRDKSFVFLSYEGLYVTQQTPQTYMFIPLVCGATGQEGVLAYLCNQAPAIPAPIAALLTTFAYANPGYSSTDQSGLSRYTAYGAAFPSHLNAASVRVDHTFSPRLSMFWRYGNTASNGASNEISSLTTRRANSQTFTFGTTNQIAPTRSNDFRVGYARISIRESTINALIGTAGGGISGPEPLGNLRAALGIPGSDASASADAYIHMVGTGDTDSNVNQVANTPHQWNVRDTFSLQRRDHLLKFGIDQQRVAFKMNPPALSVLADFFTTASLANNAASDLVITRSLPGNPVLNDFSAFAEDEWKV